MSATTAKVSKVLALVGGLAFAFSGAGCVKNTNPDTEVVKAGDTYVLMETERYRGDVGGMGISSTLRLVDGCVGFGQPGDEVLAVFPPGTKVTGSDERVVIRVGGRDYRIGDAIEGGTRQDDSTGTGSLSTYGDLAEQVPESCRDREAVDFDPAG